MTEVRVDAFAKVNLSLEVLGKRADGFHEVRSVMQSISIADRLTISAAPEVVLECDRPELAGEDNLVLLAARALLERRATDQGALISLRKAIPVASGLGGASSDAAAALVGLAELWGLRLRPEDLHIMASELGSDVPFFLTGGSALVKGRGHLVYPLGGSPRQWLVLLMPPHAVSRKTSSLYRLLTPENWSDGARTERLAAAIESGGNVPKALVGNVFESVADSVFPSIPSFRHAMSNAGCPSVHLSGAGPALYCMFDGEPEARSVASVLSSRGYSPLVAQTTTSGDARPRPLHVA